MKGNYRFKSVQAALERRLKAWRSDREGWVEAMAASINQTGDNVFRWFDSGDLQGAEMLTDICAVAEATPNVRHWLPTREAATVRDHEERFPGNLTVRVSASMVDMATGGKPIAGTVCSAVHNNAGAPDGAFTCPAYSNNGKCGDCRACWNPEVAIVSYPLH